MELGVVALVVAGLIVLSRVYRWISGASEDDYAPVRRPVEVLDAGEVVADLGQEQTNMESHDPNEMFFRYMASKHKASADLPGLNTDDGDCYEVTFAPALPGPYQEDAFRMQMNLDVAGLVLNNVTWSEGQDSLLSGSGFVQIMSDDDMQPLLMTMAEWLCVPVIWPAEGVVETTIAFCGVEYLGHGKDHQGRHWHILRMWPSHDREAGILIRLNWEQRYGHLIHEGGHRERARWNFWLSRMYRHDVEKDPTLFSREPLLSSDLMPLKGSAHGMEFMFFSPTHLIAHGYSRDDDFSTVYRWKDFSAEPEVVARVRGVCEGWCLSDNGDDVVMSLDGEKGVSVVCVTLSSGYTREVVYLDEYAAYGGVVLSPDGQSVAVSLEGEESYMLATVSLHSGDVVESSGFEEELCPTRWDWAGIYAVADVGRRVAHVVLWDATAGGALQVVDHMPIRGELYEVCGEDYGLVFESCEDGEVVSRRPAWAWEDMELQAPPDFFDVRWVSPNRVFLPTEHPVLFDVSAGHGWRLLDKEKAHTKVSFVNHVSQHGVVCSLLEETQLFVGAMSWPEEVASW